MNSITKITFIYLVFCLIGACNSVEVKNSAKVNFDVSEIDLGELAFGNDATCSFKFTNTGNTPLIIQHVKTSCGCTTPKWTKTPVNPGKQGEVQINYDTSHPGMFNKTITIFYNGEKSPETLTIKGSVDYPQEN